MIYKCLEDFSICCDWYGKKINNGTVKKDTLWKLIREPIPTKKLYKLQQITDKDYEPIILYLRKSQFNKYFILVTEL